MVGDAERPPVPLHRRIPDAVARAVRRARRYAWQRRHLDQSRPRTAVFVVGCQRSGTNMLLDMLGRSPQSWIYNEGDRAAFANFRLREHARIAKLVRSSPAPVVAFKSICDAHLVDEWLDRTPAARAIWIFRDYVDVANSAVRMWGAHQVETIRRIRDGDWEVLDWRGERLSQESLSDVKRLCRDDLSAHEGAVLFWLLRNRFFYDLDLAGDPRVRLVRYEDLVRDPQHCFPSVFEFLELPFESSLVQEARTTSIRKESSARLHPDIDALASELQERLIASAARPEPAV
jgi:hypothetical protein